MTNDLRLRCECGNFKATLRGVTPGNSNLCSCYCKDCQSFAHFLGKAETTLDAQGGTVVLQLSTARLEVVEGKDHLSCLRLTDKGLMRWHTSCCQTPIGNTLRKAVVPFVGIIETCIDSSDGPTVQEVAGPVTAHVNTAGAHGTRPAPPVGTTIGVIWFMARLLVGGMLRREGRTSPFFNHETGAPIVTPRVLTPEELASLEAQQDAR